MVTRPWTPSPEGRRPQSPVRERFLRRAGRALRRVLGPLFVLALALGGATALGHYALHSETFAVRRVEVRGGERTPAEAFAELLRREAAGKNIFRLELAALRGRIEEHPWVRRAFLYRMLPDGLRLVVEEPVPTAVALVPDAGAGGAGRLTWLDEEGRLIAPASEEEIRSGITAPLLAGLGEGMERSARAAEAAGTLHRLAASHPDFVRRIAVLDVSEEDRFVLRLRDYDGPLYVRRGEAERNLEHFEDLETDLRRRHPSPQYVDLRWRGQVVVMPKPPAQP